MYICKYVHTCICTYVYMCVHSYIHWYIIHVVIMHLILLYIKVHQLHQHYLSRTSSLEWEDEATSYRYVCIVLFRLHGTPPTVILVIAGLMKVRSHLTTILPDTDLGWTWSSKMYHVTLVQLRK